MKQLTKANAALRCFTFLKWLLRNIEYQNVCCEYLLAIIKDFYILNNMNSAVENREPVITRRDMVHHLQELGLLQSTTTKNRQILVTYLQNKLQNQNLSKASLEKYVSNFTIVLKRYWIKCYRVFKVLETKYTKWLDEEVVIETTKSVTVSSGRPKKKFEDLCAKSQRARVASLVDNLTVSQLAVATQTALHRQGQRAAATIVEHVVKSPTEAITTLKKKLEFSENSKEGFSPSEAIALILDLKLSKESYKTLRLKCKEKGFDIFPSYNKIINAKTESYTEKESYTITETSACVNLQAIANKTAERLLLTISNEQIFHNHATDATFEITHKWGFDGSSAQNKYKQRFQNFEDCEHESHLFMSSFVPIQMKSLPVDSNAESLVLWKNPRPSSTRYCRPLRLIFHKETDDLVKSEMEIIQNQIDNLQPTVVKFYNMNVKIYHIFLLTMIDGKICNTLTDTSSQVCYLCGAKPSEMNNLKLVKKKPIKHETLTYGLSTLHAWIRCFECLIHVSYRLELKQWHVRGTERKALFKERKDRIIKRFRDETGLLIDHTKQGFGSSNDGNTARRFFRNPSLSSLISGIDRTLIAKFATILQVLSSGFNIHVENFKTYTYETAKLFVKLYPWYFMPASVHKILLHGHDVIKHFLLPIGNMSEEAQESRNKDVRYFREHNTRKRSRIATNEDLLKRLILASDPLIALMRVRSYKRDLPLSQEAMELVLVPKDPQHEDNYEECILGEDYTCMLDMDTTSDDADSM